jgi:aminopeptidase N
MLAVSGHHVLCGDQSVAGRSYDGSQDAVGARRLANMALRLLCVEGLGDAEALAMAQAQFESADNMTDEAAAFDCLLAGGTAEQRLGAIAQFEAK